ncbi:MAG: galactose-1-phosphate uridylyltransferase [Pseudomonadota bacterium]
MHILELLKPDGRHLTLYSQTHISNVGEAPSPFPEPQGANPHLRWHPLRGEWVAYAAFRQNRTFQPPPQYNPLAVTVSANNPTEMPAGDYEVAVFDNRFPTLALEATDLPSLSIETGLANGHCEVVVFTQDPAASLSSLPLDRIELLLKVWADRTTRAAANPQIQYVLPFENRGAEVGVTLHHPHGQIYAYPFVPPVPQRMVLQEKLYFEAHRTAIANGSTATPSGNMLCDLASAELKDGRRVLYKGEHATAFVPACARYPYEVWVMPTTPVENFAALTDEQRVDLARALKTVLLKYDGLWQRPFPYLMAWYQAPTDGIAHPETQLHAQFYPPYRSRDRLKYLAGTELAAGMFAMDALPEDKALELQNIHVELTT